jgi:nicotinamide-nucleotide amidase
MAPDILNALAVQIGTRLLERGFMLAAAESCTGGWVSMVITSVAGSSQWFERGFVTYSDESKQQLLGVKAETLATHGAVSEAVAREMAHGALQRSRTQLAVAVTGVAGPGGGSPGKPVGYVCFAWAGPGDRLESATHQFSGDREEVRRQSVAGALQGVLEAIEECK